LNVKLESPIGEGDDGEGADRESRRRIIYRELKVGNARVPCPDVSVMTIGTVASIAKRGSVLGAPTTGSETSSLRMAAGRALGDEGAFPQPTIPTVSTVTATSAFG
jgi:hypothetical protein